MIPREILKIIHQIERRTNRSVTETLVFRSLQPPAQLRRITAAVKNGNNANEVRLYAEINFVFGENIHARFASILGDQLKPFRVAQDVLKGDVNFSFKPVAQSGLLRVIPSDRLFKFEPRCRVAVPPLVAAGARAAACMVEPAP